MRPATSTATSVVIVATEKVVSYAGMSLLPSLLSSLPSFASSHLEVELDLGLWKGPLRNRGGVGDLRAGDDPCGDPISLP